MLYKTLSRIFLGCLLAGGSSLTAQTECDPSVIRFHDWIPFTYTLEDDYAVDHPPVFSFNEDVYVTKSVNPEKRELKFARFDLEKRRYCGDVVVRIPKKAKFGRQDRMGNILVHGEHVFIKFSGSVVQLNKHLEYIRSYTVPVEFSRLLACTDSTIVLEYTNDCRALGKKDQCIAAFRLADELQEIRRFERSLDNIELVYFISSDLTVKCGEYYVVSDIESPRLIALDNNLNPVDTLEFIHPWWKKKSDFGEGITLSVPNIIRYVDSGLSKVHDLVAFGDSLVGVGCSLGATCGIELLVKVENGRLSLQQYNEIDNERLWYDPHSGCAGSVLDIGDISFLWVFRSGAVVGENFLCSTDVLVDAFGKSVEDFWYRYNNSGMYSNELTSYLMIGKLNR